MGKIKNAAIDHANLTGGDLKRCDKCGRPVIAFTKSKKVLCGQCSEKMRRK